jgi:predicted membrane-bound mannosyltransferase
MWIHYWVSNAGVDVCRISNCNSIDSMAQILPNFLNTLSVVLAFALGAGAGAVMGILGAWISSKITNRMMTFLIER